MPPALLAEGGFLAALEKDAKERAQRRRRNEQLANGAGWEHFRLKNDLAGTGGTQLSPECPQSFHRSRFSPSPPWFGMEGGRKSHFSLWRRSGCTESLGSGGWAGILGGGGELMLSLLCSPEGAGERSLQGRRLCPGHPEVLPGAGQAQGQAGALHKQGTGQCASIKPQTLLCYTLLHVLEPSRTNHSNSQFYLNTLIFKFLKFFFINAFFQKSLL